MAKIIVKYAGSNPEYAEIRRLIVRSQTALPNLAASDKQAIRVLSKIPHQWAALNPHAPTVRNLAPKPNAPGGVALSRMPMAHLDG